MKKLSLILAGALLLGGISFASPVVKQDQAKKTTTTTTTKEKKVVTKEKKVSHKGAKAAKAEKPAAK
jgi:hypothetical protein